MRNATHNAKAQNTRIFRRKILFGWKVENGSVPPLSFFLNQPEVRWVSGLTPMLRDEPDCSPTRRSPDVVQFRSGPRGVSEADNAARLCVPLRQGRITSPIVPKRHPILLPGSLYFILFNLFFLQFYSSNRVKKCLLTLAYVSSRSNLTKLFINRIRANNSFSFYYEATS